MCVCCACMTFINMQHFNYAHRNRERERGSRRKRRGEAVHPLARANVDSVLSYDRNLRLDTTTIDSAHAECSQSAPLARRIHCKKLQREGVVKAI